MHLSYTKAEIRDKSNQWSLNLEYLRRIRSKTAHFGVALSRHDLLSGVDEEGHWTLSDKTEDRHRFCVALSKLGHRHDVNFVTRLGNSGGESEFEYNLIDLC